MRGVGETSGYRRQKAQHSKQLQGSDVANIPGLVRFPLTDIAKHLLHAKLFPPTEATEL